MKSVLPPYLARLQEQLRRAGDEMSEAEVRAELAAYAARHGRAAEATKAVSELRVRSAGRPSAKLAGWLNLAEGFIEYYADLNTSARSKFLRAQAVTEFAGAKMLSALASAWLAHLDYIALDPDALAIDLPRAFGGSTGDDHHVRGRACLVLAEALHFARRFDLARPWYERSRIHATAEGDEPTLSAIIFNMAWLRMGDARQGHLNGDDSPEQLALARTGGRSANSYDSMIGSVALRELDPLLFAEVNSLDGNPQAALDLYDLHLGQLTIKGAERWKCVFAADRAWCLARLGNKDRAREAADHAASLVAPSVQVDDLAATYSWLARTYEALGDDTQAATFRVKASATWLQVAALQERIVSRLAKIEGK